MCDQNIRTRNNHTHTYHCRKDCFKYSFFPCTLNDRFNLEDSLRSSESILIFKSRLLSFICPIQSNVHSIFYPKGLKFQTLLRLGFNHLNEHRFRHNFQYCWNSLCSCSLEIEEILYYLLQCYHFPQHRTDLMNSVKSISDNFQPLCDNVKKDVLL